MPPSAGFRARLSAREPLAAKVPEITAMFWVIKILTTGMGEATSDYLASISLAVAGGVGLLGSPSGSGYSCGPGGTPRRCTGSR
jgi:hypothetical protein